MKPGRTACIVPHCGCTIATEKLTQGDDSWICSKHWRLIPRKMKQDYAAERRQARRVLARKPEYREYWTLKPGCSDRLAAVRMWSRLSKMWKQLCTTAIERAAGI